jgi:hypothetical protein
MQKIKSQLPIIFIMLFTLIASIAIYLWFENKNLRAQNKIYLEQIFTAK